MGFWTLTEIKRATRVGMGMCQGSTCQRSVKAIVAKELGISPNQLEDIIARPPMRAIKFDAYGEEVEKK